MAIEIVMPRLGWNMEAGTVVEWLKRDGDKIAPGDYLFLVEGDKSTTEVEALDGGTLHIPAGNLRVGEELPVGTLLAYLVQDGEAPPAIPAADKPSPVAAAPTSAAPPPAEQALVKAPATPASAQPTVMTSSPAGNSPHQRRGPVASPRAKRAAAALGVDWTTLSGSSRSGRIVEADVRAAAQNSTSSAATATATEMGQPALQPPQGGFVAPGTPGQGPSGQSAVSPSPATPLTPIRRTIAERMATSAHTAAAVTLTTEADATALVAARAELAAGLAGSDAPIPTYNDFFARLVAVALRDHPDLNTTLTDDGIVRHAAINIGLAVDTERGLLVPVLRDAGSRSVQELAADSASLIAAARAGRLAPADGEGGTFTITNLGPYEIDAFTPIINPPQCAILGLGRIVARPVVLDEEAGTVGVRKLIALNLTFDHRIVDGGPAARFLQQIKRYVERPLVWLTR